MKIRKCRGCDQKILLTLIDLGYSPISNDFLAEPEDFANEPKYELKVIVCNSCGFVQLSQELDSRKLFKPNYVYFSSYSTSWLNHAQRFAQSAIAEFGLTSESLVLEIASNDGYLLRFFKDYGIPVLGIEPTKATADAAMEKYGIETLQEFFGSNLAMEKFSLTNKPDLIIGNNVLAHVPDIHDFIKGVSLALSNDGTATFEFPHLVEMIKNSQFDTIYHEHYSYLSITSLNPIFRAYGLEIFKVERLETHGGSLRIYVRHKSIKDRTDPSVPIILDEEEAWDPRKKSVRELFGDKALAIQSALVNELLSLKRSGARVVAFGAAAKGNTLLNFCSVDTSTIEFVIDSNPYKQGKFLPGSHIPVISIDNLSFNPDVVLVLPWNLTTEIVELFSEKFDGVKFLVAIPTVRYVKN